MGEYLGHGVGASGTSRGGVGVYGKGAALAGEFDGAVSVNGDVNAANNINVIGDINANHNVNVTGDFILTGSDCAEDFDVSADIESGTVVIIDEVGGLLASETAYDCRVAGVISGTGSYKPALILDKRMVEADRRMPLALAGKVYCKVDAEFAPVAVGSLLTTSPTPSYAMKGTDRAGCPGL